MKTRNGFVSNSSSSSFIIAVDKKEPCNIGHAKSRTVVKNIKQLNKFWFGSKYRKIFSSNHQPKIYSECEKLIKRGYVLVIGKHYKRSVCSSNIEDMHNTIYLER